MPSINDEELVATELQEQISRAKLVRERRRGLIADAGSGQLPLWDDRLRGLPNSLARGALFTCRGKNIERELLRNAVLASSAGIEVSFTGQELRQDDQDVWLQLAHLARAHPLGNRVELSAYQLLKALRWADSSRDYARLRACFERLTEASVRVSFDNGRNGFKGHLVEKVQWADAGSGKREAWRIRLDPEILELFSPSDYSLLDWRQRMELRTLAKWLHSFYSTHREPLPLGVKLLFELSGSSNKRLSGFRRDLESGMDELVRAGFLTSWKLDAKTDVIHVRRNLQRALPAPSSTTTAGGMLSAAAADV